MVWHESTQGAVTLEDLIYDELLPWLDRDGIQLSQSGVMNAKQFTDEERARCKQSRKDRRLFNIKSIRQMLIEVPHRVKPVSAYKLSSYSLKHMVERCIVNGHRFGYVSNGDMIVVMLLLGYKMAVFNETPGPTVNPMIMAKWIDLSSERFREIERSVMPLRRLEKGPGEKETSSE